VNASRVLTWWFGLMALGGFAFGLYAERRPFGDDVLAHPLLVFFVAAGVALLALRVVTGQPVPNFIPERMLVIGCLAGVATFLAGNWLGVHVLAR
jgi:hypothetical protein